MPNPSLPYEYDCISGWVANKGSVREVHVNLDCIPNSNCRWLGKTYLPSFRLVDFESIHLKSYFKGKKQQNVSLNVQEKILWVMSSFHVGIKKLQQLEHFFLQIRLYHSLKLVKQVKKSGIF